MTPQRTTALKALPRLLAGGGGVAMPAGAVLAPALMNIPRLFVPGHHRGGGLRTTCAARRSITRNQNQENS